MLTNLGAVNAKTSGPVEKEVIIAKTEHYHANLNPKFLPVHVDVCFIFCILCCFWIVTNVDLDG